MDFSFTEEQTLLAESVQRYLDDRYSFEARKQWLKTMGDGAAHSPTVWNELAGLGVLALLVPRSVPRSYLVAQSTAQQFPLLGCRLYRLAMQ